ncbi:MAG: amphi-Trp domain-containing protein [Candidatus Omnitrophota bacterium]
MTTKQSGEFELDFLADRDTIVKYLSALSEGFSNAELVLGNKRTQVLFEPDGLIDFRLKARRRSRENKISIKISWKSPKRGKKGSEKSQKTE